jgi:lysyl-tRNA synthetase, class I
MTFWVDDIAKQISEAYPDKEHLIIRDEKTASGRVHVGSLRGVIIHGVIAEALNQMGRKATFMYEINDVDPMDGLPVYLDEEGYAPYMGMPLRYIPAPDENGKPMPGEVTRTNNFARHFGNEFIEVIKKLGFTEENNTKIVWASELYEQGIYNEWIEKVCAHPDKIRQIYREVSGSEKSEEWFPLQVVCEKCGKVGSTIVTGFENGEAIYRCEPNRVEWAKGCSYEGKVAPYNGIGKVPWKVEWAVKWAGVPVDIEGSGKDHNAAGGSHDVSERICKEILEHPVPFNIPYEFFLFGGAKMSASKGLGATAKGVSDIMPPELLRFLMVRSKPNQPIDFNIDGETIPRLYDKHDECARIYFGNEGNEDLGRAYHYAQLDPEKIKEKYFPRFSKVGFMAQLPHLDVFEEVAKMKQAPLTELDKEEATEREAYVKVWLENFADDRAKFEVQSDIPDMALDLNAEQKNFLKKSAELLKKEGLDGEALHGEIHQLRKDSPLEARDAFGSIYASLLGKKSGPQAGWFLEALERDFVIERFEKVAELPEREKVEITDAIAPSADAPFIIIRKDVREQFPGIKLGFNVLSGVKIEKNNEDLEALRKELWEGLDFMDLKMNSPRLEGFSEIYRGFGVKPSKNKPSPVALVSRLSNGKELPNINVAVDIYNAVAVKHQLAIGLFNVEKLTLPVELAFAKGGEEFHPLTGDKTASLMPGELCYFDGSGLVMARDFNYLDSKLSMVTDDTTNLLLNVDGNQNCSLEEVEACLAELEELLQKYCGGTLGERVMIDGKI